MSEPTKVTDGVFSRPKTYPGMPEFSEWHPWGTPPDHTTINENYIPVRGGDQRQFDYPAALQRLIDHTWKVGNVDPTAPRDGRGLVLGASPGRMAGMSGNAIQSDFARVKHDADSRRAFGRPKASAWYQMKELKQVAAYTFRGDTRSATQIRSAGGFYPPSLRTDDYYMNVVADAFARYLLKLQNQKATPEAVRECKESIQDYLRSGADRYEVKMLAEYHSWRAIFRREEMHIGVMTDSPFLKAYVSTTRDMTVALEGSAGVLATDMPDLVTGAKGWIYAVRVEPGFLLKPGVAGVKKDEAEVAHLGPISWKDVYGFRCFTDDPALRNRIFIRYNFDAIDNVAFKLVLGSLSTGLRGEAHSI
jgi:hypothetical protein